MKAKLLNKIAILSLVITSFSLTTNLPVYAKTDTRAISTAMTGFYNKKGFNGVVLVAENGKVIYKGANGYADFKNKVKLTTNSVFNLASVSKQFTAMAIMILAERKKLNYQDNINKYLPGLPYTNITILNLLQHTSGLPDYLDLAEENWDSEKTITNKDVLDLFKQYKPKVEFKSATKYEYSNTGYAFLASIVESASGQNFEKFIQENIFNPLKMTNSYVYNPKTAASRKSPRAYGYSKKFKLDDITYLDGVVGDGGIYSNVDDLFKWDQALYTEKLVKLATLKKAFEQGKLNNGEDFDYGFGWEVIDENTVYHSGVWAGFRTSISRYRDSKDTVIILTNNSNENTDKVEDKMEKLLGF